MNSDLSWRLPLIFQAVPSAVVILAVWFLPESPRWLMANQRDEEAREFLVRYHGGGDVNSPLVELEWTEFKEGIEIDGSDKRWWDYSSLFNTPSARWRSLMVLLMGVFGQFSGNGLGYFNTEIYAAVGYDNYMQFVLNLANSFCSAFGAGCGVALADKMPRRKVLVIGTAVCAVMLAINGGLSAKWAQTPEDQKDLKVGRGAVAAFFFFNIIYSFAYTPLQALYPVECLQTNARAKGMAMYAFVVGAISFINLYAGPIALKNIVSVFKQFSPEAYADSIPSSNTTTFSSSSDGISSSLLSGTCSVSRPSAVPSKNSKRSSVPRTPLLPPRARVKSRSRRAVPSLSLIRPTKCVTKRVYEIVLFF